MEHAEERKELMNKSWLSMNELMFQAIEDRILTEDNIYICGNDSTPVDWALSCELNNSLVLLERKIDPVRFPKLCMWHSVINEQTETSLIREQYALRNEDIRKKVKTATQYRTQRKSVAHVMWGKATKDEVKELKEDGLLQAKVEKKKEERRSEYVQKREDAETKGETFDLPFDSDSHESDYSSDDTGSNEEDPSFN